MTDLILSKSLNDTHHHDTRKKHVISLISMSLCCAPNFIIIMLNAECQYAEYHCTVRRGAVLSHHSTCRLPTFTSKYWIRVRVVNGD